MLVLPVVAGGRGTARELVQCRSAKATAANTMPSTDACPISTAASGYEIAKPATIAAIRIAIQPRERHVHPET